MRKLLVICGPTATGKTSLALHLAGVLASARRGSAPSGELVSADSRQVYKDMDIGTGKDLPRNSKFQIPNSKLGGSYEVSGVRIWCYDLVSPKEEFSVAQYAKTAKKVIEDIWSRNRLPILVGGTGLYIKAIVDGIPTVSVPKNPKLRKILVNKTPEDLFESLSQLVPIRAASLNASDRKNPRRLIRAIEIAVSKLEVRSEGLDSEVGSENEESRLQTSLLFIGLTAPREFLYRNIEKRVNIRLEQGVENEIKQLLASGVNWDHQAMKAIGYRQWRIYFERSVKSVDNRRNFVIENWIRAEKRYAKRQMTWFKKDTRINWFDITRKGWQKDVEKMVRRWYHDLNHKRLYGQ